MFKLVIVFILKLFVIVISQNQIYLECKFDDGTSPCRLIPYGTAPELKLENFVYLTDAFDDPLLPLSDVTSITSTTLDNNSYCNLPYQLNDTSKDIYFCSRLENSQNSSGCITTKAKMQECVLGNYVELQLESTEKYTYYIEVTGIRDLSCLSFYYYITRPNAGEIVIRSTDLVGGTIQQIGHVSSVPYNGWHRVEFSFNPDIDNYRVYFDLQRLNNSNDMLFIALDEIMIIDGSCNAENENSSMSPVTQELTSSSSAEFTSAEISSTMTSSPLSSSIESSSTTSTQQISSETSQEPSTISISTDLNTSDFENSTATSISPTVTMTPSQSITTTSGNRKTTSRPESRLGLVLTLTISPSIALIMILIGFIIYRIRMRRRLQRISGYNYEKYFPMASPFNQLSDNEGFNDD